jgi:hypothetical protein
LHLLQRKLNRAERVCVYCTDALPCTEPFSEKYLKKLIGRTDIEDALNRLDKLTQEEGRMASAQLLKVTNTIDNRVGGIADNVFVVDNRVAGVENRVAGIGDQVQGVDDKVTVVMAGMQYIFHLLSYNCLTYKAPRWKRGQGRYPTSS